MQRGAGSVILIIIIAVSTLAAVGLWLNASIIRGSGEIVTEQRQVEGITDIVLRGQGTLRLFQGDVDDFSVTTDDNIISHIRTTVDDGVLTIDVRGETFVSFLQPTEDIRYDVTVRQLKAVSVEGAGTVINEATLSAEELALSIKGDADVSLLLDVQTLLSDVSGKGTFALTGKAASHDISISGSGEYDARDLESEAVTVDFSGTGEAVLNATQTLDVTVTGSGDVKYVGTPAITEDVSGTGSFGPLDGESDSEETEDSTDEGPAVEEA